MSKSLRKLVESEKYDTIHSGIKLARANIGRSASFLTIPYFCAFLLKRYLKIRRYHPSAPPCIPESPADEHG